jgi:hypothetical protein
MARMTDSEADALDERWTTSAPKVGPNGTGFFAKRRTVKMISVDSLTADFLMTRALATHKTPSEVISDMVEIEMTRLAA